MNLSQVFLPRVPGVGLAIEEIGPWGVEYKSSDWREFSCAIAYGYHVLATPQMRLRTYVLLGGVV